MSQLFFTVLEQGVQHWLINSLVICMIGVDKPVALPFPRDVIFSSPVRASQSHPLVIIDLARAIHIQCRCEWGFVTTPLELPDWEGSFGQRRIIWLNYQGSFKIRFRDCYSRFVKLTLWVHPFSGTRELGEDMTATKKKQNSPPRRNDWTAELETYLALAPTGTDLRYKSLAEAGKAAGRRYWFIYKPVQVMNSEALWLGLTRALQTK